METVTSVAREEEWQAHGKQIGLNREFQNALKEHLAKIDEEHEGLPIFTTMGLSYGSCKEVAIEYFQEHDKFDFNVFLSMYKDL